MGINGLSIGTESGDDGTLALAGNSSSNFYPVTAYLPKERDSVASELQFVYDTVSEAEMEEYRRNLKSLG